MARIALIGAGMGALATAARLAVAGHRVTVFERARTHGGAVGRYARDGFAFDTGPGLLHLPAVYRDLFVKTGKEPLERCVDLAQVDPSVRHLFADGSSVSLPNASRSGVMSALDAALGTGSGERWSDLLGRAREVWEATRRPLLEDALAADPVPLGRDPYPAMRRPLLRRGRPTLTDIADRELRDARLETMLYGHALAYGLDPRSAPAAATVLPYLEQTFGTWYVRGGMRALADAVYARCVARGVEFRFGAEVTGVLERDGRVAGVGLADGERAEAERVVSGIHPHLLDALLSGSVAADPAPQRARDTAGGRPSAPGRFTVCLALRGERPADAPHRTVVHPADAAREWDAVFSSAGPCASPTVTVLRPDDPSTVPDPRHEAVTLQVTVAPHGPVDWTAPGRADDVADRVTEAAEAAVPGLRERVLWREVRTPADTAAQTGAPGGSVPWPALAGRRGAYVYPSNTARTPGLHLVGGWAHPGGGLPHTGMSGAIVADLIAGGPGGSR